MPAAARNRGRVGPAQLLVADHLVALPTASDTRSTLRIEILKICHVDSKDANPESGAPAATKANCRIKLIHATEGQRRVLHCDNKICNLAGFGDAIRTDHITKVLAQPFFVPRDSCHKPNPFPLEEDLRVVNEDVFEGFLQRFEIPVVNYALHWLGGQCHYGKGSRCGTAYKPDWSLISPKRLDEDGCYMNLVPGDTKLDAKWRPELRDDGDDGHYIEWQKVVAQITNYMAYHESRYGFVITERNLVVFRLTRRPIEAGIATSRSRRLNQSHVRYPSDATMGSSDGSFVDDNPLTWAYCYPQYVVISWSASGRQLTVKLALWASAMMATNGGNSVEYRYPELDTWRRTKNGFVHNTSGTKKAKLGKKDKLQDDVPARETSEPQHNAVDNTEQMGDRNSVNLPVRPAAGVFKTERISVKPTIDKKKNAASFTHKELMYTVEMDTWIRKDEDTRTSP